MIYTKVSILTTVYNREKYLAACIESVLVSTYQDWELIFGYDVSTDTSVAIAIICG
jgi:glycosyltransferase involved in cell wall biosynthesis